MKRFFSLMAVALLSVAMMAGGNDLLWDYTEGRPTVSPDSSAAKNGALYWNNYVNDAAGTNNGLKGLKLNSSGYGAFKKAPVAGKLKLSFGPRSGSNATCIEVWNATWGEDGKTPAKGETKIATTGNQTEYGTQIIELTAEQNDIYLCRGVNVETALQVIEFKEDVARSFVDFEMIMCNMAAEYDFTTLPAGVTASGTFNSDQHGYRNFTITVPVDGTVRFTIGDCKYGNQAIAVKNSKGETIASLAYPAAGCYKNDDSNKDYVFTYNYLGAADTLTFGPIQYCNYFKAEAAEITPCEIIFKDQNGTELGRVQTFEGANLEDIPYTVDSLPAIGEGNAFRGWFYTSGKKAKVGDPINGNTTIQAKVTPIEAATVGSVQTYDFASAIFYPEDHETVTANGGAYYNNHGWYFNADGSIDVQVAGNAVVVVTLCQYSESGDVKVMAGETELAQFALVKNETADGTEFSAKYTGEATTLTINWTAKQYIHKVVVYNVLNFLEKDEATGYILVPSGDAAAFILALVQAESGDKIFLPNGTYDLGETVLTTISKNNISVIGQSMEGVIIKNAPDYKTESIDKTATLRIAKNVQNTYLQDLTIQNALDYYKNDNGRAVALWDQGTKTICKNVRLLSYQDTYYSNLQGAVKYFRDCEIHGTVDFICGDGSVYFKNTLLYAEKRNKAGSGSDALTANNGPASDKGYVFESCTVKSECPVVSFGRAWNNTPTTTFLNTLVDYSAGDFTFESGDIARWTKKLMNANAWPKFGEYNTHLADGTVLTPASNVVTFVDEKSGNATQDIETVLSAEQAAAITMEYTLGNWTQTALDDARQVVCDLQNIDPEGVYLVEDPNSGNAILFKGTELMEEVLPEGATVRKANRRGGFGAVDQQIDTEAIDNCACSQKAMKIIRDGQLVIVRDNKEYNVLGAQL